MKEKRSSYLYTMPAITFGFTTVLPEGLTQGNLLFHNHFHRRFVIVVSCYSILNG